MSTTEIPQLRDGTETVDPSATVGEQVTMIGYARVLNMASAVSRAKIINGAKVIDTAAVHDNAEIIEHAIVYGNARVFGSAVVDGAEVGGNAYVGDHARIHGNAVVNAGTYDLACDVAERNHFVTVGPIGSEGRTATFFRSYAPDRQGWVGIVAAGCFRGSVDKLEARLDKGEAWSPYNYSTERIARYDAEYSAFIALARVKESSWGPITDPDRSWWEKRLTTQVDGPWLVQRLREFGGGLMVSTDPRPTSAKRIPGQVVRDFVEALGLNPDQITQVYIGPRLITVHLRLDLGEGMLNQLMREHPGVTVRGDSTHVEADISFAVDWEGDMIEPLVQITDGIWVDEVHAVFKVDRKTKVLLADGQWMWLPGDCVAEIVKACSGRADEPV